MITLVLHLLRLLPFLFGGHRQLALENLALRQQLAVYRRTIRRPKLRPLRDRDHVYGRQFRHRVKGMGIEEVLTAPQSPWQNPFAERLIGSIRRECLSHVLVLSERHLRRILTRYFAY